MIAEQLNLLSAGLPPLRLHDRVRVIADGREGVVAAVWPSRDWYLVDLHDWTDLSAPLPNFRRDELELLL